MSRANRDRRLWRCQKCGAAMPREDAERMEADARRKNPGVRFASFIHTCGDCHTLHYRAESGAGLRLLTPAERLRLELDIPRAVAAAEAGAFSQPDRLSIAVAPLEDR